MYYLRWITPIAMIVTIANGVTETKNDCPKLITSQKLNVSQVMGTWYGIRGIEHNDLRKNRNEKCKKSNMKCPTLTMKQEEQNEISFRWSEMNYAPSAHDIRFIPDTNNPNLWKYVHKPKSTELSFRNLQVTEIDTNNIIITICAAGNRLASAVLSREPKFNEMQVVEATKKLSDQGLSVVHSFNRCQAKDVKN